MRRLRCISMLASLAAAACAQPTSPSGAVDASLQAGRGSRADASRTLVFIARAEPDNVVSAGGIGVAAGTTKRLFNGTLTLGDDRGSAFPFLAEALPVLHSESWKVFPDGRMETTYRLKANLTWHDGAPFTAEDLVFTWRAYAAPELGASGLMPQNLMEDVTAGDSRTVVIRWRRPLATAGLLAEDFRPLPRHLLESVFLQRQPDAWENQAYWTRDFVGLGPFRIERWEPGTFVEGGAFDNYALGRPRIDRVRIVFITDPNTVLATLLSGEAQLVADTTIRFQTAAILKREWEPRSGGTVILTPAYVRFTFAQFRPEIASPRGITDLRVRKAVAHAIDRSVLVEALFEGQGIAAELLATPRMPHFPAADGQVAKYAYDLRRVEQSMAEAGYTRGADGSFTHPVDGRFAPEWRATSGGDSDTQLAVLVDMARRAGIDAHSYILPQTIQDPQTRASFAALFNWSTAGPSADWLTNYTAARVPGPETRWAGNNRGGWSHPEYERVAEAFATSLDGGERTALTVQMLKLLSEELPVIPLYYNLDVAAHATVLHAPRLVAPDGSIAWNIHEWELK